MLAVVDVLDGDIDSREALAHRIGSGLAGQPAAVRVPTPRLVDLGELGVAPPGARVEQLEQTGAVGAGL